MKMYFCKNLIISAEENERFEMTNICWICGKLIENTDNKVRDHCHIMVNIEEQHIIVVILILKLLKKFL